MLSNSYCVPQQNGLVWFFRSTFSKTLAWHIVFRTTRSKGVLIHSTPHVPLVVADLEPGLFKNALHLPEDTLAYVASSVSCIYSLWVFHLKKFLLHQCYGALLRELHTVATNNHGRSYSLSHYPSPATVHTNVLETLSMLLQSSSDPGHPEFMAIMRLFCSLS